MEVTGETCKLCLKYIQGDDLALLDETILGKLKFLQMDLDQSVEESNALCKECEEKIESAFDFKCCLVNTESCLVPYISKDKTQKVNLRVILEKDTSSSGKGKSLVEKEVCRLCKNFVKTNTVMSLPKVLKDDTIMEVFQGHIPEMDLDVTENPMVCDSCHNSLASFLTLIASWSIANGWNEDDEDMKVYFQMVNVKNETLGGFSDSNTNSSTSFLENSGSGPSYSKNGGIKMPKIQTEINEISDSTSESVTVPKVIKKEECADEEDAVTTIDQDLKLKCEEVEIKDEDGTAYVASTSSTPFAQPIIAVFKSKAQKQREYRQRIAASRTPAQARSQRQHEQQQSTTTADQPGERVNLTNEPLFSGIPVPMKRVTAVPKTRAQIQREYRQRLAASRTPAQAAAAREARNVRDRNNRLRQAANLAIARNTMAIARNTRSQCKS